MPLQNCDKAIIVRWLKQMGHFVNDDVFEKILGFLSQFCIEPDMPRFVTAASPLVAGSSR
jgi:hypothetical protein